jgi:predicted molibdopterin-dependent oxidoreductase YjgC
LDAAFVIASAENPVIVYKDTTEVDQLLAFAGLINAKLVCLKGNANSLAASQLGLDKTASLEGKKVLFIASGDEDLSQKSVKEFEKVPFKVVHAAYASSLTSNADVVLPSTDWLEQQGHYINSDGFIAEAKLSLQPGEETHSPFEALGMLAEKLEIKLSDEWTKKVHERISPVELIK